MEGIIYCVRELSTNEIIYIGSTTNLHKRVIKHMSDCFNCNSKSYNKELYRYVRTVVNEKAIFYHYFTFETLYKGIFADTDELRKAEDDYIGEIKPKYNIIKAYLSEEEYRLYANEQMKKFYINNHDKVIERCHKCKSKKPEYYSKQHHDWVNNNRERLSNYRKDYRKKRLLNETDEEREMRLKKQRDYMRERRAKQRLNK